MTGSPPPFGATELPPDEPLAFSSNDLGSTGTTPRRSGRFRLIAFGLISAGAVAVMGVGLLPSRAGAAVKVNDVKLPAAPQGLVAPSFSGDRLNGSGRLDIASLRGKVVVVNFWASWCGTCKVEAAVLGAAEKQWRDRGVVFVGVDSRDTTAPARAFEQQYGIEYDSVVDPTAEIGQHFYVTGFPETYVIGRTGTVVSKYVSAIDAPTLNQEIAAAVAAG